MQCLVDSIHNDIVLSDKLTLVAFLCFTDNPQAQKRGKPWSKLRILARICRRPIVIIIIIIIILVIIEWMVIGESNFSIQPPPRSSQDIIDQDDFGSSVGEY